MFQCQSLFQFKIVLSAESTGMEVGNCFDPPRPPPAFKNVGKTNVDYAVFTI